MTEPDQKLIERTLIAIQAQLATLNQRVADVLEDQKSMREQVDVIVMTSLRIERGMTALRQDVRQLRERVDGLEVTK
jgi:predicted ribosome quality control (RQC) complex YloA/Tae2 family protein